MMFDCDFEHPHPGHPCGRRVPRADLTAPRGSETMAVPVEMVRALEEYICERPDCDAGICGVLRPLIARLPPPLWEPDPEAVKLMTRALSGITAASYEHDTATVILRWFKDRGWLLSPESPNA